MNYVYVGLGGLLGSTARYWVGGFAAARFGEAFPYGTFFINVSGSFLLGLLIGVLAPRTDGHASRLFLGTGFCGGYTTFSTYTAETVKLLEGGSLTAALGYFIGGPVLGLAAAIAGMALGQML